MRLEPALQTTGTILENPGNACYSVTSEGLVVNFRTEKFPSMWRELTHIPGMALGSCFTAREEIQQGKVKLSYLFPTASSLVAETP